MRHSPAIVLLLLLLCSMSWAQHTASSYKTQATELGRTLVKNPNNVETLYRLALFYFDNSHPMRNLPAAMRYATQAEQRHAYLLKNDKVGELLKLQRNNIDINAIHQLRESIAEAALNVVKARKDMPLAEIDDYLETFGDDAEINKLLRSRRMTVVYKQTMEQGGLDDCYQFMITYARTREAEQAEQHLAEAVGGQMAEMTTAKQIDICAANYPQSRQVSSMAERYKSRLAFADAEKEGTLAAYNEYLTRYPASDESEKARARIEKLLEVDLARRSTTMQLAHFADSNADSPLADKALAKMRKLIYRNHDVAAARYYVEHYQMDPHANEVYGEYYSWYSVEGNAGPVFEFSDQNPDFPFQRAMENDIEKGDYVDRIDLTRPFADTAYDEYAGYVKDFMGKPVAVVPLQRMLQKPYASRNYTSAIAVAKDMETYFDNNYRGQYEMLLHLLGTPTPGLALRTEMTDSVNVMNPVVNPSDGMLYFSDGTQICRAMRKANRWELLDTVRFVNSEATGLSVFGFYAEGKRMLLGSAGDIWIAERDEEGWRISDIPPFPVNTDYVETDAYMLPDGSGMLLASDRPGGFNVQASGTNFHGDTALATDLYFVPFSRHGWGTPVNLGLMVNSVYSERSPIMSRNLRTLYYVSDAHTGLGYGDIYMTERTSPDDWTSWTRPRNLGREVNSPWHESGLSFADEEKRVYLSSDFGGGTYKAYSFPTSHNNTVGSLTYNVDVSDASPTLVRLQVADMQQQTITQVVDYEDDSTALSFRLDRNHRYALLADAGSRFVTAMVLSKENKKGYRLPAYTYEELVAMDRPLPLPVIEFDAEKSTLSRVARMQLEQLARFALVHPECKLEMTVDVEGRDATKCFRMSFDRADAIRDYLTQCGVAPESILLSAYGNARCRSGAPEGVAVRFRE